MLVLKRKSFEILALLYVMFFCVFVTLAYGVLSQVEYLIALVPDLFLLSSLHGGFLTYAMHHLTAYLP